MKHKWLLLSTALLVGQWTDIASAVPVHEYRFESPDPYADSVGDADLSLAGSVGTIVFTNGYASFPGAVDTSGNVVYLSSSAYTNNYDPFVLSIWFRIPSTNQQEYASIFASNPSTGDGFQINFLTGWLSVNINASVGELLPIIEISNLTTNTWHLLTLQQDPVNGGQVWLDDFQYVSTNSVFGALNAFRLGVNRAGRKGFLGDIAEVTVYDGENWDDQKQATEFSAPPAIPEPTALALTLLFGLGGIFLRRRFLG